MSHQAGASETADTVARRSYGKLLAFLAARSRDLAAAEDALSDAFAAAISQWPSTGPPDNPEAWLLTVARRKLIDAGRRRQTGQAALPQIRVIQEDLAAAERLDLPDQRLALMFACAHPAIPEDVRAPLILQTIMGLNTQTIASSFLTSPAAMSKRLVRAKDKIRAARIPFALPDRTELPGRLAAVLDAIYAAFCEGWSDPAGADLLRSNLTGESLFLAGLLCELLPEEPEALAIAALMFQAEARRPARRTPEGHYVPLAEQDTSLWNPALLAQADRLLRRASSKPHLGRFELEAALQSAHVHRCLTGRSNWREVLALYDALLLLAPSPVVAINRALAVAEVAGVAAGLAALPTPHDDGRLASYQPYWAAQADLLARTGQRFAEAEGAYDMAIGLERDPAVRAFLQKRRASLSARSPPRAPTASPSSL